MNDLDDVERIYRESAILTSLKHPNIIRLYEVLDSHNWVLIIMEYASGGELLDYIAKEKNQILSEPQACKIFNSILAGLEYCHRRKVIHRDLKLENILLDKNGNIKIADFGLSNTINFGQKMSTNCGTPNYIAPEIIRSTQEPQSANSNDSEKPTIKPHSPTPNATTNTYNNIVNDNFMVGGLNHSESSVSQSYASLCDIWSLGVILYSMICGFLPFEGGNIPELYKKILAADYIIPEYISVESKSIIQSMLTLDIKKRITLSQIKNHIWTQMEFNGLSQKIGKHKPTLEQIKMARSYNVFRKKKKPQIHSSNTIDSEKSNMADTDSNTITIDSKSNRSNNSNNTVHITLNTVTSNTKTLDTTSTEQHVQFEEPDIKKHSTNRYLDDITHGAYVHGHVHAHGNSKKLTHSKSGHINTNKHNTGKLKVAIANHYKNHSHTDEVELKLPKINHPATAKLNKVSSFRKDKRSNTIHFERGRSKHKSASKSNSQSPNKRENAINALKNKLNRLKKSPGRIKQSLPFNSHSSKNSHTSHKTPNKSKSDASSSSSGDDDDSDEFRRSRSQTSLKYSSPIVGM